MAIRDICKDYFAGFREISDFKTNKTATNTLALAKIVSYFTVIFPLIFGAVYAITSLYGRVCNNCDSSANNRTLPPQIISNSWDHIRLNLNGASVGFRDVVILPTQEQRQIAESWNWKWDSHDAMHHNPGIRIKDLDHYIFSKPDSFTKPDVIILSRGRGHGRRHDNSGPGILQVNQRVIDYVTEKGIEVHVLKTAAAITKYNELRTSGKKVAAFIHTTC